MLKIGAGFCSLYQEIHYFEVRYIKVWVYYLKLNKYYFYKMINIFCVFKRKIYICYENKFKPKWIRILTFLDHPIIKVLYWSQSLLFKKILSLQISIHCGLRWSKVVPKNVCDRRKYDYDKFSQLTWIRFSNFITMQSFYY